MPNEEVNNNINWKNKLEETEISPGEVFNKEVSWNKLYKRLQPKEKNKKAIWYSVAAAFLLFALFISLFLSNKEENILVKNDVLQNKINTSSSHVPLIKKDTSKVISSTSNEDKVKNNSIGNNDKTAIVNSHKIIKPGTIYNLKNKEEAIIKEISNNAVMPVDTAITIAINLPEKKKLQVFHINELGESATGTPATARFYNHHSLQFKFINQESYTTSSHYANNKALKNFTTINLPSN